MSFFPKWFLLDETPQQRNLRHAELRKRMADKELADRLAKEAKELAAEVQEDSKDRKKNRGRHRKP